MLAGRRPARSRSPRESRQVPGDIQVPKGIQAVKEQEDGKCIRRVTVVGDALFDFNKSVLRGDAEVTLAAAGPEIAKAGGHKVTVIGHTDTKGGDAYNDRLSEARARTVRDGWRATPSFRPRHRSKAWANTSRSRPTAGPTAATTRKAGRRTGA